MARYGRGERLSHWLSLEAWVGMGIDALVQAIDDGPEPDMFSKVRRVSVIMLMLVAQ